MSIAFAAIVVTVFAGGLVLGLALAQAAGREQEE